MKHTKLSLIGVLLILSFSQCALADVYYCSNTMKYVQTGDNIAHVRASCGEPESSTTREEKITAETKVVEWMYNIHHAEDNRVINIPMKVTFDERTMEVKKIEVGGSEVQSTNVCRSNTQLKIGDTQAMVLSMCDAPAFRNVAINKEDKGKKKVTIWTYRVGQYSPQTTIMEFDEHGILESIKTQ